MFWVPLLMLACALAALSCGRLCLAAMQAAAGEARGQHAARQLTLYEAAFLSGGPGRVADVALLSMARGRRLLLAHTGWATVVDPVAGDDVERSVLGAIGPAGQSRIAPVRRATAAADCVRALADRLVAAGLAVPDGAWSGIAGAARQVRAAAVAVAALGVCATLLPGQGSGGEGELPVAVWFALPFFLTVSCLGIARFEVPATRWASPAGQRLLGALPSRDDLTSVAVRGLRALDDPALRAALSHRDPNLDGYREARQRGH
ncbi:TIGR04222 domain-containing membrane protein [Streptomyces aurantiacus]|uniref:Putative Basic salivary proline-rich protein 4 n=1 Tax=Streptomyces aurantiacus JA 4570 TaxID=1286094 RepID=S3ZRZ6_9ACTN|nr:TIGR04222 domain-containing membrane protein [Streptomyces aurantiacus]EPH41195.1 putative Basic salivary proline-rich protein 4 [Streptomyces aurantiacus JA 4570]